VIFTVLASLFTPRKIAARDSSPRVICFAIILSLPAAIPDFGAAKEIKCQNHDRGHQQQVNQAGGYKTTIKTHQPEQ
jgi:hypothetical protein